MTQTIRKSIGEGFAKGELYAALAYDTTDRFGGMKIKGISFNPVAGTPALQVGDSTTAWTALYTDKAISIYSTCASTNTGTTAMPVYINAVYTGAGQLARCIEANLETEVALGSWANAIKGYFEFTGTSGRVTGLASAICAEMKLPSATLASGVYAILELEWVGQASTNTVGVLVGVHSDLIYANVSGTATDFDSNGYFLELEGVTAGASKVLSLTSQTLKCGIVHADRYLVLSQMQDGLGLGVTGTHMTLTASTKAIDIYTTTVATASTVQAARINLVGAVGTVSTPSANLQALNTNVDVNVVTGSSITSIYAQMTYGASGDARGGMASALCAELKLPGKTLAVVGGSYCIADLEMWTPASYLSCTNNTAHITAFQRFAIWGDSTAVASFEDYGYLFNLNGFTSASGNLFYANTIRCIVGSTAWYLPLSTAEGSYTTAYPIVSTAATAISIASSTIGITSTVTASTATTAHLFRLIDSSTSGVVVASKVQFSSSANGATYHIGEWIDFTCGGNTTNAHAIYMYLGTIADKTISNYTGIYMYMEDFGTSVTNLGLLGLEVNSQHDATGESCFIRVREHGVAHTIQSVLRLEGSGTADYLLAFEANYAPLSVCSGTDAATYRIAVRLDATSATKYIRLYDS